jgi:hypothetical protein
MQGSMAGSKDFFRDPASHEAKAFRPIVPYDVHDVMLYVLYSNIAFVVARICHCEHIQQLPLNQRCNNELSVTITNQMATQAQAAGATIVQTSNGWQYHPVRPTAVWGPLPFVFQPNVRYEQDDLIRCQAQPVNIDYLRYGALLVDGDPIREATWQDVINGWQPP